jgi:hypothetical protein
MSQASRGSPVELKNWFNLKLLKMFQDKWIGECNSCGNNS